MRVCRKEAGTSDWIGGRTADQFSRGSAANSAEVFKMKTAMVFTAALLACIAEKSDSKVPVFTPPTDNQVTDGRLEIFSQERKATLAELRALPESPQDAETAARVRRLKEDLAGLDREIARVRFPNSATPIPRSRIQADAGMRAPRGAISPMSQISADAGKPSFPGWDVFRNFPSKEN
jgi:hypothetical protein